VRFAKGIRDARLVQNVPRSGLALGWENRKHPRTRRTEHHSALTERTLPIGLCVDRYVVRRPSTEGSHQRIESPK